MNARDPQRILRTVRRATAGSLLVAAVGSGVVAVHLAGDHAAAAAATRAESAPRPAAQSASPPGSVTQPGDSGRAVSKATPTPARTSTKAKRKQHKATTSAPSSQAFTPVAPVQPGSGPAQSGSGGS